MVRERNGIAWSLVAVSYSRADILENWVGTRMSNGVRVCAILVKPLPDIIPDAWPPIPDDTHCHVLMDELLEAYEPIARPPERPDSRAELDRKLAVLWPKPQSNEPPDRA